MKIGLQINHYNVPDGQFGRALGAVARTADDHGFSSLWVLDHFFQMEGAGAVEEPMLEAYTTLGYLAALTQHITLGVTVTGVIYRHPGVLIKTISTLDVLSGGRAWLGIGAAWYEREALALGIPFPPTSERFERLEETLQIAHRMWKSNRAIGGDRTPFKGEHYHLSDPLDSPAPIRQPHPPILVGGMGEKKTLRLVAQYADASNFDFPIGFDQLQHKLAVLRQHCEAVGRDYDRIEKTTHGSSAGMSAAEIITLCERLRALGFSHVIFNMPDIYDLAPIERIGREVIPQVANW